jgi:hypothetical protein
MTPSRSRNKHGKNASSTPPTSMRWTPPRSPHN